MKTAVYPGSFDPVTVGHLDIIKRASAHFDRLTVTIMANSVKRSAFTVEERICFLRKAVTSAGLVNVDVAYFDGLLADYAKATGAMAIVKGLRAVSDFEYEFQMALVNRKLNPEVDTMFFIADQSNMYVSSSIVKDISYHGGDISGLVCPEIEESVLKKLRKPRE